MEVAPPDLPAAGQREWQRVMHQLQPLGVLTLADLSLLKSYCQHVATMETAAAALASAGYTTPITNKAGATYHTKSPWVSVYNEACDRAARLGREFGLTPSGRTRISTPPAAAKAPDPWQTFD